MVIVKNISEFKNAIQNMIEGEISEFKYNKTTFTMNEEDGSITMSRPSFKKGGIEYPAKSESILPSRDDMDEYEMIDEVVNKYNEFSVLKSVNI